MWAVSHSITNTSRITFAAMNSHNPLKTEEANAASWEAAKGAGMGAAKWGAAAAILAVVGRVWSPVYRGTTVQFKVYAAHRPLGSPAC